VNVLAKDETPLEINIAPLLLFMASIGFYLMTVKEVFSISDNEN
jgi:hypothetical protein